MKNIFAVYKPSGPTSHDIVDMVRKVTGVKKVGHGGTLDPLAEGVLVIAVGREATKQLDTYVKGEKEYIATVKLGEYSETDDEEGSKKEISNKKPSKQDVQSTIETFVGNIIQTPPKYSAVKIKGRSAYKYARAGKTVKIKPRPATIHKIDLLSYDYPFASISVSTGPGVYIRTLARDIGEKLGTGAYLQHLKRTRVAGFTKSQAIPLEELETFIKNQNIS